MNASELLAFCMGVKYGHDTASREAVYRMLPMLEQDLAVAAASTGDMAALSRIMAALNERATERMRRRARA